MNSSEFAVVVGEAMELLPDEFRSSIENLQIVIEDHPPDYIQNEHKNCLILGLYQGVPLPKRGHYYGGALPDKISIYKNSILRLCKTREETIEQIKRTLLHEIGHYYGITDAELRRLGY